MPELPTRSDAFAALERRGGILLACRRLAPEADREAAGALAACRADLDGLSPADRADACHAIDLALLACGRIDEVAAHAFAARIAYTPFSPMGTFAAGAEPPTWPDAPWELHGSVAETISALWAGVGARRFEALLLERCVGLVLLANRHTSEPALGYLLAIPLRDRDLPPGLDRPDLDPTDPAPLVGCARLVPLVGTAPSDASELGTTGVPVPTGLRALHRVHGALLSAAGSRLTAPDRVVRLTDAFAWTADPDKRATLIERAGVEPEAMLIIGSSHGTNAVLHVGAGGEPPVLQWSNDTWETSGPATVPAWLDGPGATWFLGAF